MRKPAVPRVILWIVIVLAVVVFLAAVIPFVGWLGVLYFASARAEANRTPGQIADDEAVAFHEKYYNASREGSAYDKATPEFKTEMPREDFLRLMETMHRQLGDWRGSATDNHLAGTVDDVTTVDIDCTTYFEKGEARETMRYVVSPDRKARLRSFHIELPGAGTSPATNP